MQDGAHTLRSLTLFVSSHFMFNVLGKLQSEILSGEKREAISTLTLYSRLMRQACNIGLKEKIPLSEEGLFLDNYLKLEKARFVDAFDYDLKGFDPETVLIEPFILQPFIEMALLGSLGAENNTLDIEFDKTQHTIRIDSAMLNPEVREKLAEKCGIAIQRLQYFNHSYEDTLIENRYLQKISLTP